MTTSFQKIIDLLENATAEINKGASQQFIESTAILIHEAMSGRHRRYHTVEHIFQVLDPKKDPVLVLAALFHDVVYYGVDEGFTQSVAHILEPYITVELGQLFVRRRGPQSDLHFPMVNQIFDFNYGQLLTPEKGMNEYLSALVFCALFRDLFPTEIVLGVVTCIEATIPFRGNNEKGEGPFEILETRLHRLMESRLFQMKPAEIEKMVEKAVFFANLDVGGFALEKIEDFIDQTWRLFPEYNLNILQNPVYSVANYRMALQKMTRVFKNVKIENVFHQYRQSPSSSEFKKIAAQAEKNATITKKYLEVRTLAIGFVEALCVATGGDLPLNMILGNVSSSNEAPQYEVVKRLDKKLTKKAKDLDDKILSVIHLEDNSLSSLQKRRSTLAGFFYISLGEKKIVELIKQSQRYFDEEISAEDFLYSFDAEFLADLIEVFSDMVSTRRTRFLGLLRRSEKVKPA